MADWHIFFGLEQCVNFGNTEVDTLFKTKKKLLCTVIGELFQLKLYFYFEIWYRSQLGHRVVGVYTQRKLFEILLNQPEIRLYLPFSDWFGSKRASVWIQINRKMVDTIWFQVDSIRLRENFSVCFWSDLRWRPGDCGAIYAVTFSPPCGEESSMCIIVYVRLSKLGFEIAR